MYNTEQLSEITEVNSWIFGNYNSGTASTNKRVRFGSIGRWINKEGIYNIFSIPKLKDMGFCITYDSLDGHYIVHAKDVNIKFNKD